MALRLYVIVASAVCIYTVTCAAYEAESSSTAVAESSQHVAFTRVRPYTRSSSSGRKKCKRVRQCPINEEFSVCTESLRRAKYCSQRGQTLRQLENNSNCTEGCVCQENFLRSYTGICVPENECEQECGPGEVLRKCPADCASDYCPTKDGKPPSCKRPAQGQCPPPVCKCAFNHRRATNGMCIPTRDCPPFDCSARPNEEYNSCPPLCPSDDCSQASSSGECPSQFGHILIVLRCNPSCRCIKGYWRKNGICVPYEECNKTAPPIQCSANEEVRCVNVCPPEKTCKTRDIEINCLSSDKPCENKCVCKKGYYRNFLGTCISNAQCDQCSKLKEFYACDSACDNKCSTIAHENRTNCPIVNIDCNRQCYCEDGFARDNDGNCVPVAECHKTTPPIQCSANEEVRCVNVCPPETTCKTRDIAIDCLSSDKPCENKCVCKKDYYRNFLGTCISNAQCDQCSKLKEFYACDSACDNKCSTIAHENRTNCPIVNIDCNRQCYCEDGFARDNDGNCVPVDECPNICPINEEYNTCTQAVCRQQNCSTKDDSVPCPRIDSDYCKRGCVCKENYYRDENGTCVAEDQCPPKPQPTCSDNEVLDDCPTDCPSDYCPTCDDDNNKCPTPDTCPPPACKCKFNYRRDENGSCIPTEDCPPFDCSAKLNEQWTPCPPLCPSDSCSLARATGVCPFKIGIRLECNPKCQCKNDYGRNEDGTCVPLQDCPNICPINEEYNTCTQAVCRQQNCSTKDDSVPCPRIDSDYCKRGCVCKENYYRDENGTCVAEDQCPPKPQPTCSDNEVLDDCPTDCPSDYCPTCDDDNNKCPTPDTCPPPACKCKFNYRRDENGSCIPTEDCPPFDCSAKLNEQWTPCPPLCPSDSCSLARATGVCPFKIGIRLECNPKCQCKNDYGRNEDGTCVPLQDCPNICPINEEYNTCTQAVCRQQNCSTKDDSVPCPRIDSDYCKRGCVCKENYYRDENGTCVAEDQCPPKPQPTCSDNEVLDDCPTDCPSDYCPTCDDDNNKCPTPDTCPPPACKCKFNYRRDENGSCIPTEDCPPFDCSAKLNEQWTPCPPLCPSDSCSLARATGVCPFKIGIRLECNPKCQCKNDYGRNEDGTCVPLQDCPNICPINEEYNTCTQAVCRQQNCSTKDDSVPCPRIDSDYCKKGCVCKENYYRDENGTCVAEDQCPPKPQPTCSDNEVLDDCPTDCPSDYCPTCDDDNNKCPTPDTCPPPECKCKFNYRRDENGSCIPTEDCPPFDCSAKLNEQWTPCPPLCPSDSCSLARATGVCPFKIGIRLECNPKCQCKNDYGRNEDGTCVPLQDCPNICPINEEYNTCTQAVCRQQNCSTKDDSVPCPRIDSDYCKRGCVCKENYYRDANGDCVPEDQCIDGPSPTCTDNEILDNCPSDCASDYCPKCEEDNKTCPKPKNCPPPACKCKFNYRRADNGTCISTRDCPPFDCSERPHEKYNPCPFLCPTDECSWPWIRKRCPFKIGILLECRPKCQCKDNYGRVDGTCVPFKECPDLCPENEEYSSCTQGVCRPQNCSNKCDDEPCPKVKKSSCNKGCVCKENYFRDDDGDCVPEEECPDPRCLNPHEVYKNSLVPNCPAYGTCKSLVSRIRCEEPEAPGCVCKSGYLRSYNQTSPCIPQCECKEIANTPECKSKIKI